MLEKLEEKLIILVEKNTFKVTLDFDPDFDLKVCPRF
jgi:hypothetical protein